MKTKYIQKLSEEIDPLYVVPFAVNKETNKALMFEDIIKKLNEHAEMLDALKEVYKDLTYKVRFQDGLTLQESNYNTVIGQILKEIES